MKKENFSIDILKEIIKEIGEKHDILSCVWNGGRDNIDCKQIHENMYLVKVKCTSDILSIVKQELLDKLKEYKLDIIDEQDKQQNARNVKEYYIANKKDAKEIKKRTNSSIKIKIINKKSIVNGSNCTMDNSINTSVSPTIKFDN